MTESSPIRASSWSQFPNLRVPLYIASRNNTTGWMSEALIDESLEYGLGEPAILKPNVKLVIAQRSILQIHCEPTLRLSSRAVDQHSRATVAVLMKLKLVLAALDPAIVKSLP